MEQGMPAGVGRKASIRYTIFTYFTISALAVILLIGVTLCTDVPTAESGCEGGEPSSVGAD